MSANAAVTTACPASSVSSMAHPMPTIQASVIRSQGTELSPLPCIMPTQSIGIFAGAAVSIAVVAGLAAIAIVWPKSRSEEHTSELQSLMRISYAVFCLKKKKQTTHHNSHTTYYILKRHHQSTQLK